MTGRALAILVFVGGAAAQDAPFHTLTLDGDDPLLSYQWDGGTPVPAICRLETMRIDWGAAGLSEKTLLYLPLDEGAGEGIADLSASRRTALASGCAWTQGRFGSALRLDGAASIRVGGTLAASLEPQAWTLDLWVRPFEEDSRGERVLWRFPGRMSVRLLGTGTVTLRIETQPPLVLWSKEALERGAWGHVAVVFDGPQFPQVRLVVNGVPRRAERPGGTVMGCSGPLVIGGFTGAVDDIRLLGRAASTHELVERHALRPTPGEHALLLRFRSREQVLSSWTETIRNPILEGAKALGSGALRHVAVIDGGLRRVSAQWERDPAPAPPLARTTHPTVFLDAHRAFVFGGEARDTHVGPAINVGDTWIYHIDTKRWERILSPQSPPPGCHQGAAFSPDHRIVLWAGGWRNDVVPPLTYRHTWAFDVDRGSWRERGPGGPQLSNAAVVYAKKQRRFLLFRGRDVHVYDPENDAWERRRPPILDEAGRESPFRPGGSMMAGLDPETGRVVLFGGELRDAGRRFFPPATLIYDPEADTLVVRETDLAPPGRVRAGFAYDSRRRRFVLFGGVREQDSERFGDLWTFDPSEGRWLEHASGGTPSPRGGYFGMAYDPELDVFALLCGRASRSRFLDEAWRLRFDGSDVGTATYVFDRRGHPDKERFFVVWESGDDRGPGLRFQGSSDGVWWTDWSEGPPLGPADGFLKVEVRMGPEGSRHRLVRRLGFATARELEGSPTALSERRIELAIPPLSR